MEARAYEKQSLEVVPNSNMAQNVYPDQGDRLILHLTPYHEDHFDQTGECLNTYKGHRVRCLACKDWQHDMSQCDAWADITSIGDRLMVLHLLNLCRTCLRAKGVKHQQKACTRRYLDWPMCSSRNMCPWAPRLRFRHNPILCQGVFDPLGIFLVRQHFIAPKTEFRELLATLAKTESRADVLKELAIRQAKTTTLVSKNLFSTE